jgi:sucrose phosphorylase
VRRSDWFGFTALYNRLHYYAVRNEVQLIAYADRLGGTLQGLRELLRGHFRELFGAVHLLPFFPLIDGADAGFDPIDHMTIDPRLGDWHDVRRLGEDIDIIADIIVNHISNRSPQFQEFSAFGRRSRYEGMFLTFDAVFPHGASERDLLAIYRPRPRLPFTPVTLQNGERRILWTTFTPEQIDINVTHPCGRQYLEDILRTFSSNGIRTVRLDAAGYAVKKAGQSCFMMPETFSFIGEVAERAKAFGIELLVEVHSYYRKQLEIARQVDWVYDFALPPLVLHSFFARTARALKEWIRMRPNNCLTVLDTHDGIGIIDVGPDAAVRSGNPGLLSENELVAVVERIHTNSRGESAKATGAAASNLDLYQINCTFYDALARNDVLYLLSRAVQFFLPGIPQVYYVGLLAGINDLTLLAQTGVGRDINRHHYTRREIDVALARPVVSRLQDLIRLRNSHPAFAGQFELGDSPDEVLELRWCNGAEFVSLRVDLATGRHRLAYSHGGRTAHFELSAEAINPMI